MCCVSPASVCYVLCCILCCAVFPQSSVLRGSSPTNGKFHRQRRPAAAFPLYHETSNSFPLYSAPGSHSTMRPATVSHFTLHRVPTLYQVQLATLKLYFTFPLFSTLCSRLSHSRSTAFPQNRTFGFSTPMYVYDVAMKV